MSTKRNKHESENEDDPEPFESSGDEWDAQEIKNGRRKSSRVVKKPKRVAEESGSEDLGEVSDEEFFEEPKKKKPGPKGSKTAKKQQVKGSDEGEQESSDGEFEDEQPKKKKAAPKKAAKPTPKKKKATNESEEAEGSSEEEEESGSDNDSSGSDKSKSRALPKTIYSEDFATGSFVILKKDAKGGAEKHPVIWRIDGKALLQKFEAFDEGDKIRHRNTSIYTGWSPLDQELYGPLTVDVISHYKSSLVVEVHWNELSAINVDSE